MFNRLAASASEMEKLVRLMSNMYSDLSATPPRPPTKRAMSDATVSRNGRATQTKRPTPILVVLSLSIVCDCVRMDRGTVVTSGCKADFIPGEVVRGRGTRGLG